MISGLTDLQMDGLVDIRKEIVDRKREMGRNKRRRVQRTCLNQLFCGVHVHFNGHCFYFVDYLIH